MHLIVLADIASGSIKLHCYSDEVHGFWVRFLFLESPSIYSINFYLSTPTLFGLHFLIAICFSSPRT